MSQTIGLRTVHPALPCNDACTAATDASSLSTFTSRRSSQVVDAIRAIDGRFVDSIAASAGSDRIDGIGDRFGQLTSYALVCSYLCALSITSSSPSVEPTCKLNCENLAVRAVSSMNAAVWRSP